MKQLYEIAAVQRQIVDRLHGTPDAARHAVETDDMYIIKPNHPWWSGQNWAHGRPLPEGFRYASDSNTQWMTGRELKDLLSPPADSVATATAIPA